MGKGARGQMWAFADPAMGAFFAVLTLLLLALNGVIFVFGYDRWIRAYQVCLSVRLSDSGRREGICIESGTSLARDWEHCRWC